MFVTAALTRLLSSSASLLIGARTKPDIYSIKNFKRFFEMHLSLGIWRPNLATLV